MAQHHAELQVHDLQECKGKQTRSILVFCCVKIWILNKEMLEGRCWKQVLAMLDIL